MGDPAGVRRDFEALEKRRFQAIRLLDKGLNQSEIARRVKVVRQTVARWVSQYRQQGAESLKRAGRAVALHFKTVMTCASRSVTSGQD
jgi:transposase